MERTMTAEAFEMLVVCHGPEPRDWPATVKTDAALAFAATAEGSRILMEERAFRAQLQAGAGPLAVGADAFLDRLMDIPLMHEQAHETGFARLLRPLLDFLDDSRRLLSPAGLAAQAAAGAAVLMVGVVIGMGGAPEAGTELDLSTSLFSSTDLYLGDQ